MRRRFGDSRRQRFGDSAWRGAALSALACAAVAVGCSSLETKDGFSLSKTLDFDMEQKIPWATVLSGQEKQPARLIAVWTDAVLHQEGQPSQRGFGGRLMFHRQAGGQAVKVEGELVVFAFRDDGYNLPNAKPDRKYVFTAEQLAKLYGKNQLGHTYSVWLPWDQAGGLKTQLSLIARFTPKDGSPIVSEQTRHILPGREPAPVERPEPSALGAQPPLSQGGVTNEPFGPAGRVPSPRQVPGSIRPAAYETAAVAPHSLRTTTLSLPPNLQRSPTPAADPQAAYAVPHTTHGAPVHAVPQTAYNTSPQAIPAGGSYDLQPADGWSTTVVLGAPPAHPGAPPQRPGTTPPGLPTFRQAGPGESLPGTTHAPQTQPPQYVPPQPQWNPAPSQTGPGWGRSTPLPGSSAPPAAATEAAPIPISTARPLPGIPPEWRRERNVGQPIRNVARTNPIWSHQNQ